MATKKNANVEAVTVDIPKMEILEFDLRIVGDKPLIVHA